MMVEHSKRAVDGKLLLANFFPNHVEWLNDNYITYSVTTYFWPDFLVNNPAFAVMQLNVSIDNASHAEMFKSFSGIKIDSL